MPLSLLAAFLGGVISLLSPCSAMILPSFLATGFQQKHRLLKATFFFSLGVLTMMLPLGLGFFALLTFLNQFRRLITLIIGVILVIEAVLQLFGHSLFVPRLNLAVKSSPSLTSSFYFGLISGVGITSCVGPVLGAIITLAANSFNLVSAVLLIFSYTLGLVLPLFLLSWLWQRHRSQARRLLQGKVIQLGSHQLHLVNLAAALLFFFLGYLFIFHQGSFGIMSNFSFDLQDKLFSL